MRLTLKLAFLVGAPLVTAVTVIPSDSFSSYSTFETYWNYLYPWGSDHNGSMQIPSTIQ
ncbi:hypothetical protein CPB85DRAFT_1436098 [Mucidula mucida]|nr:hypothetical protein CPB85DRAFT_1436098 [Mucidula mucida]